MSEPIIERMPGESIEDFLWRVGSMKDCKLIDLSWSELADILNHESGANFSDESTWRKRYRKMLTSNVKREAEEDNISNDSEEVEDEYLTKKFELDKTKIQARDERYAINRIVRREARADVLLELFSQSIERYNAQPILSKPASDVSVGMKDRDVAVYAMLSDIHYGIAFKSRYGEYDPEIAASRVMEYADAIIDKGKLYGASHCYVSLMGDMVSGVIHHTIRIENRENIIDQVIGVSELVSAFLYKLSGHFNRVFVNSVSGNHSRIDMSAEEALRSEKLDALIPWYCKTKLSNCTNVTFVDNDIDATIASFSIFGKSYFAVHGDYDKDLRRTVSNIELTSHQHIDYMLAGHLHIADCRFENTSFIRNGAVCGSGDEYTIKNRLFGPPCQVFMIVTPDGVESVHPVMLT